MSGPAALSGSKVEMVSCILDSLGQFGTVYFAKNTTTQWHRRNRTSEICFDKCISHINMVFKPADPFRSMRSLRNEKSHTTQKSTY